jgi:hypothetical protein
MMVVRVATKDVENAKLLVVDLVSVLGAECVSLQADGEVQLQLRGDANGAMVRTLEAVERWLEQTGTASAEVCVDERSYTVAQRDPRSISSSDWWSMSWDDSSKAEGQRVYDRCHA